MNTGEGKPQGRRGGNLRFALRVGLLLLKGFTLALISLLALAGGAFYVLQRAVDAEKVRAILIEQLQAVTHRPVQIAGVILTPKGIKVQGVKIRAIPEGGPPLLESEIALVTIKVRPLLERRLELKNVRLVSPRINLSRDASGSWNLADIFVSSRAAHRASVGRFSLPISLAAERTVIEGGVIRVEDRKRGTSFLIERFNLGVDRFDPDHPFPFNATFDNVSRIGGRQIAASASLEGAMSLASFDWASAYLRADRIELDVDGASLRGSGGLTGFDRPVADLELFVPALDPQRLGKYFNRTGDLSLPAGRWRASMDFPKAQTIHFGLLEEDTPPLLVRSSGTFDWTGGAFEYSGDVDLGEFPLEQAAALKPGLGRYALKGAARGQARISGWVDHWVVHQATVTLRRFSASAPNVKINSGEFDLQASGDFALVSAAVSSGSVSAYGHDFTEVALGLRLAGQDLRVDRLSLRWGDTRLKLKARVVRFAKPKEVQISGNIDRLRWERAQDLVNNVLLTISTRAATAADDEDSGGGKPWVETFKYRIPRSFPDTVGHVHIGEVTHKNFSFRNTDLLWDLHGVTPSLKKVSGEARVGFGPGRVDDIQAVQDSHKFLKIVFLPYIYMHKMNNLSVLSAATAYPKTLDFNRIEGQYGVSHGVVDTRFSDVDSPQLVAYTEGSADFGKETVDMKILTRLTSYRAPLPEWWVDELGRPAIGFRVKGDLSQPDLEPRLHKIRSDEIEKLLAEARRRAKTRFEAIEKLQTLEQ